MLKPHCMATFNVWPERMKPSVPNMACPSNIVTIITSMGSQYCASTLGSTSIPTDTKNTAPKRFFTGSTSLSIASASTVSANMLPIMKAPKAAL